MEPTHPSFRHDLIARSLAALPLSAPGAGFRGKVLAALRREREFSLWAKWALGAAGSLGACGEAALIALAASRLTPANLAAAAELLRHPVRLEAQAALGLGRAAVLAGRLGGAAQDLARAAAVHGPALSLQLLAASALAALFVSVVVKPSWRRQ
ncbi:MAG: hypothetical protein KGL53_08540 [Elusimicrobia bacterium]|nr:hypothetical protein [Elusimicrobiota bacterium]